MSKQLEQWLSVISVLDDYPITSCLHNAYISLDDDRLVFTSEAQTKKLIADIGISEPSAKLI